MEHELSSAAPPDPGAASLAQHFPSPVPESTEKELNGYWEKAGQSSLKPSKSLLIFPANSRYSFLTQKN